jgi:L-rhamnose mutarotase
MKTKLLAIISLSLIACGAFAFSAYENYLLSGETRRAALIARINDGAVEKVDQALEQLSQGRAARKLKSAKISGLSAYSRKLADGANWLMIYFDYEGGDYLQAAADFESATANISELRELTSPHPRAERYGRHWLQMEWICYIRGAQSDAPTVQKIAMVTRIKPEKEMDYRLYHQAVWPGVVDQMARGNNRNFSIFLAEIGDEIYEFFYTEYCGEDSAADGEMNAADPANQRWWKFTDPCQTPLEGASGPWAAMEKIL